MIPKKRKDQDNKKFSISREKHLAKKFGARRTPNSGATTHFKGDLITLGEIVDIKSAKGSQIIITIAMLDKLVDDAFRMGREPVLMLDFPNSKLQNKQWILLPKNAFEE